MIVQLTNQAELDEYCEMLTAQREYMTMDQDFGYMEGAGFTIEGDTWDD